MAGIFKQPPKRITSSQRKANARAQRLSNAPAPLAKDEQRKARNRRKRDRQRRRAASR